MTANRLFGLLCNVGQGLPSAMSFRTYHLLHHCHLDEYDYDADLAFHREARLVGHSAWRKAVWLLLFAAIETIRPLRVPRPFAEPWAAANVVFIAVTESAHLVGVRVDAGSPTSCSRRSSASGSTRSARAGSRSTTPSSRGRRPTRTTAA